MKTERSDINDLINENIALHALLASIVTDVEAMRIKEPDPEEVAYQDPHWFGWFDGVQDGKDYTHAIEWPNLSLLIEQAKQLIKENKWTTNKKSETSGQAEKS